MFQALVPEQLADYREIMQPAAQAAPPELGLSFLVMPKLIPHRLRVRVRVPHGDSDPGHRSSSRP